MAIVTFAGIDIGSYEVGMKIFELNPKSGIKELTYVRHRIDLGKDTYNTGRISPKLMEELCEVLLDFKNLMKEYRVTACRACASSAIRESDNALLVLDHIKVRTGIEIEPLSNSEHRFLGYKSIACLGSEFEEMIRKGTAIFDVGGGSIQISLFDKDKLVTTQNIRMGIMRTRERLHGIEDRPYQMIPLIEELVNNEIITFKKMYVKDRDIRSAILVGDYINYIFRKLKTEDGRSVVSRDKLLTAFNRLLELQPAQITKELGVPLENESMMIPAIVTYRRLIEETNAEVIWAPGYNLCDGLAFDYAEKQKLIKSNHNFEYDIVAAARNLSKRYQADKAHINAVEEYSLAVFDAVKKMAGLSERDRLLLDIAALLHQCGKFITVSKPADCSYEIIMATEIIGLSHKERNLIANVVRLITTDFPAFDELAAQEDIEADTYLRIAKLTAILRVGNALDRSHMQKFKGLKGVIKDTDLVLSGETTQNMVLEIGLFDDKEEFFREVFGIGIKFKIKKRI